MSFLQMEERSGKKNLIKQENSLTEE
jgi:hypothetical protein